MIYVDKDKCTNCRVCERSCHFGYITFEDYPVISDECKLCMACVKVCPLQAIKVEKKEEKVDLSGYKGVTVFAEQSDGVIAEVTLELLGKAREIAEKLNEEVSCVLLGGGDAKELIAYGADVVYVYKDERLEHFRDDPYNAVISELAKEIKPSIMLIGATAIGRSLAPRVAVSLRTGLTADCTYLEVDEKGRLAQTRPAFGGNIMATIICPNTRPQMATVRHKVMKKIQKDDTRIGKIIEKSVGDVIDRVEVLSFDKKKESSDVINADIIIAGGKGVGNKRNFEAIKELAILLNGAVGGSRPAVDEGWLTFPHQIGLSGKTVGPKLYIACGISGTVQHLAGMQTSDVIVAINNDPNAPIFDYADYGIVGDCNEIVPELIEKIKNHESD